MADYTLFAGVGTFVVGVHPVALKLLVIEAVVLKIRLNTPPSVFGTQYAQAPRTNLYYIDQHGRYLVWVDS